MNGTCDMGGSSSISLTDGSETTRAFCFFFDLNLSFALFLWGVSVSGYFIL